MRRNATIGSRDLARSPFTFHPARIIIAWDLYLRSLAFIRGLEILNETGRREHASNS